MKILIPTSGGVDSATLLYETLRDTNYDVIALRVPEDSYFRGGNPEFFARERAAFWAICEWCGKHQRSFDAREGDVVTRGPDGTPYDRDRRLPIRPGRAKREETFWAECRYGSVGYNAARLAVDEVRWGLTCWNSRLSAEHHRIHIGAFEAWSGMEFVAPWIELETLFGARRGRSKLDVLTSIPPELRRLAVACTQPVPQPSCPCKGCAVRRFYSAIYAPNPAARAAIEDRLNRLACIGPYAGLPTRPSYGLSTIYRVVSDLPGWRRWLDSGRST